MCVLIEARRKTDWIGKIEPPHPGAKDRIIGFLRDSHQTEFQRAERDLLAPLRIEEVQHRTGDTVDIRHHGTLSFERPAHQLRHRIDSELGGKSRAYYQCEGLFQWRRHTAKATVMSDLVIRRAAAADLPAITAIYAHAVAFGTATFEVDPPDETEMERRWQKLIDGGFPYLVAEHAGMVRGYAYAGPYRTRVAYRHTLEDSIYIAPEFHRRGIGRALIGGLLDAAETAGFRQIVAVIGDSAQRGSIALHRAAGFRTIGTFEAVGYKFERWLDTVLMQRPLGAGAAAPPSLAHASDFNSPRR